MNALFASADLGAPSQLAPAWLVVPLAAGIVVLIWMHLSRMSRSEMPESRRRIRSANGLLLLLLPPLMTYALTMVSPQHPLEFVLAWAAVAALLALVVMMAVVDAMNTLRLARRARQELRLEVLRLRASILGDDSTMVGASSRRGRSEGGTLAADGRSPHTLRS